ncbi:hypothetical protein [Syntrophomonas wolfei]|uniref:hypothetical protein n=1 Tax=Syntrophomonas wolfei TaxID=863 RepID=UPI000774DDFF|nr:hypothetical protein [Syntrophomonas wolfei]
MDRIQVLIQIGKLGGKDIHYSEVADEIIKSDEYVLKAYEILEKDGYIHRGGLSTGLITEATLTVSGKNFLRNK